MIDIKIRAWDKVTKIMVEVTGFRTGFTDGSIEIWYINRCGEEMFCKPQKSDIELMQDTGIKDKNGKKIYEGDIFKFDDEVWSSTYTSCGTEYDSCKVENYGVVGYDEDTARFDFIKYKFNENSVESDLHEYHDLEFAEYIQELEVIGNIYENPELLENM